MADIGDIPDAPRDEWAQVEIFGHRNHIGRILEVERFGSKMLRIDIPTASLDVFETLFYGGSSVFSISPMTEDAARAWAARQRPRPYRPDAALPPPAVDFHDPDEDQDDQTNEDVVDPADRDDTVDIL